MLSSSNCSSNQYPAVCNSRGVSNICSKNSSKYRSKVSPRPGRISRLTLTLIRALQNKKGNINEHKESAVLRNKHQTAEYLGVSLSTVNRLIFRGQLKQVKIGRSVRIAEEALADFISRSEVN